MPGLLAFLALLPATPGDAASVPAPPAASPAVPAVAPWNPAADYITAGQDEPGYRAWYAGAPWRPVYVRSFHDYLAQNGVAGVVPTWQLLRTATSWQKCGGEPFEVPPTSEWPHIVQTLRYINGYVVPAIGPVEAVSGYRNPALNVCAGGAPASAHKSYSAIDLVPLRPTNREELMRTLCTVHSRRGSDYGVGLGFYAFLRFHVDTTKFRRWGADPATHTLCPPIVRPADIASVALPAPAAAARQAAPPATPAGVDAAVPPAATDAAAPVPPAEPAPILQTGSPQR